MTLWELIFEHKYGRPPTAKERAKIEARFAAEKVARSAKNAPTPGEVRESVADLIQALVSKAKRP